MKETWNNLKSQERCALRNSQTGSSIENSHFVKLPMEIAILLSYAWNSDFFYKLSMEIAILLSY